MRKDCAVAVWFVYSIEMSWNVASASLLVSVGELAESMLMLVLAFSRTPNVSDSLSVLRWFHGPRRQLECLAGLNRERPVRKQARTSGGAVEVDAAARPTEANDREGVGQCNRVDGPARDGPPARRHAIATRRGKLTPDKCHRFV